jgi:hypothetical protein
LGQIEDRGYFRQGAGVCHLKQRGCVLLAVSIELGLDTARSDYVPKRVKDTRSESFGKQMMKCSALIEAGVALLAIGAPANGKAVVTQGGPAAQLRQKNGNADEM